MDERMFHLDHDGAIKQRMESDIFGESEVGINSIYQYCYYYKEYEDTLPPDVKTRIERLRCETRTVELHDELLLTGNSIPVVNAKNDLIGIIVDSKTVPDTELHDRYITARDNLYEVMCKWYVNETITISNKRVSQDIRVNEYLNTYLRKWVEDAKTESVKANTIDYIDKDIKNVLLYMKAIDSFVSYVYVSEDEM